ncbi:nuclear pore-associated protein 1 [Odocoileus virginianus]|uniref:Nuclear pore-associated protein 1 n=1 Tax=Odocoileus virginianus TaxID=9874 RepID=A0A6J0Y3X0_ODOVR
MGNLLCKLLSALRRRRPRGRRSLVLRPRGATTSGRGHPAAPAPALQPGRRLLNQDRVPSSSGFYGPKQQPVLSTRNSMMFGPSRTIRIPPLGRKTTLLRSLSALPLQVAKAGRPVPTSHRPLPCAKESKAMVQEDRREGMTEEEGHTEAEGEDNGKMSPDRSGAMTMTPGPQETGGLLPPLQCSPEPPNLLPGHPGGNFSEKVQVSQTKPSSQSPAICSDGTAGDGRPPSQPGPLATVLSAPSPCCSLLPERPVEVVLGEDHQPGSPESLMSGKALQHEPPTDTPRRSSSPLGAAGSRRPCKRKMPPPLPLPLPPLLPPLPPPLPLPWGRSDLPPPPKLPGMTRAKTRCTRKQNMDRQRNRMLTDARKAMRRRRSTAPPAPGTTGALPPVSPTLQVPPTTTDLADLSSRFPNLAGLPPWLTPYMDRVARHTAPVDSHSAIPADSRPSVFSPIVGTTLKGDAGTPSSVRATPPLTADLSTPLSTPTLPFQPPSYKSESPTPMCVDSPPPLLTPLPDRPIAPPAPTGQPITSTVVPSATTVTASASVTVRSPRDQDVTDMDTTPPSQAIILQSPPGSGVQQTHTAGRPDTTSPFVPMVSCRASIFNYAFHSQTNPHPAFAATDGQQRASVFPGPSSGAPAAAFPGPSSGNQAAAFPGPSSGNQAAVFPGPSSGNQAAAFPGPSSGNQAAAFPGPSSGGLRLPPSPGPHLGIRLPPSPGPHLGIRLPPSPGPHLALLLPPSPGPHLGIRLPPSLGPHLGLRLVSPLVPHLRPWVLSSPAALCRTPASVFPTPPSRVPSTLSPSPPSTAFGPVFPGPLSRALAVSLSPQIMALGPASPSPPPMAPAPVFPKPPPMASAVSISTDVKPVFDINAMGAPPPQTLLSSLPLTPSRTTTPITWLFLVLRTQHPVAAMPGPKPRLTYLCS